MNKRIEAGATAGLAGGVVSGMLLQLTRMTTPDGVRASAMRLVAGAVHTVSVPLAWLAYLVYAALIGAAFGWLLARQRVGGGSGVIWGGLYGGFWWIVSGLVVIPILHAVGPLTPAAVDLVRPASAPWFAAMVVDGAVLGGVYAALA
jgi:hypothetical protein